MIVQQFDGAGQEDRPWLPCDRSDLGCGIYSDRRSVMAWYAGLRLMHGGPEGKLPLYSPTGRTAGAEGGFIIDARYAKILCGYAHGSGRTAALCRAGSVNCVPGCSGGDDAPPEWCVPGSYSPTCVFPPARLGDMLEYHRTHAGGERERSGEANAEVILDVEAWVAALPQIISGVFYLSGHHATKLRSEKVWRRFRSEYPDSTIPLLELDPASWDAPFRDTPWTGLINSAHLLSPEAGRRLGSAATPTSRRLEAAAAQIRRLGDGE